MTTFEIYRDPIASVISLLGRTANANANSNDRHATASAP